MREAREERKLNKTKEKIVEGWDGGERNSSRSCADVNSSARERSRSEAAVDSQMPQDSRSVSKAASAGRRSGGKEAAAPQAQVERRRRTKRKLGLIETGCLYLRVEGV